MDLLRWCGYCSNSGLAEDKSILSNVFEAIVRTVGFLLSIIHFYELYIHCSY